MSFSRAPLKRFNENVGCAPPPGTYELKPGEPKGAVSFQKSERFKLQKFGPLVDNNVSMSPVRRTMSVDGLTESAKKDKSSFQFEMKQRRLLEKEIRSLVQQRGEQDRRVQAQQEDLKKLEAKLLAAVREKTGLAASIASFERQLAELQKTNDFLKTKFSADTTKKRIQSLSMDLMDVRNKLDAKDKEMSFMKISFEGKVKMLETDLEASGANLNAFKERNKDLDCLYKATKAHSEELEKEMDKLHAVIHELREDLKVLQSYFDAANEEIQGLKVKLQDKSVMAHRVSDSEEQLIEVEKKLEKHTVELQESHAVLKNKEQELQKFQKELQECHCTLEEQHRELERHKSDLEVSQTMIKDLEKKNTQSAQELKDSQNTVKQQESELARVKDVLRRTEEELDQRVAHMNERCLNMEDERARTQEEGLKRVQELLAEISSMEESKKHEKEAHDKLKEQHSTLVKQFEEKKVHNHSLSSMLVSLHEDWDKERKQLEEELEGVLEEVTVLEEQDRLLQDTVHLLTREKLSMEEALRNTRAELESSKAERNASKDVHQETQKKLQDEHNSLLGKMADMATQLESATQAQRVQREKDEARVQGLKEDLGRITQQLQDEQNKFLQQQHTHEKETEEYARRLLEAQTKLSQYETDFKQAKEELGQEQKQKQKALAQLEQARHHRRESAECRIQEAKSLQEQVEVLKQEKEQLHQQMEQERHDFNKQLTRAQERASNEEWVHWKNMYDQLYAKVKPFQEQLDAFAAERDSLLSEKGATQAELNELAGAYANLLGHQNQRQKIKHMVKIKEENLELKQEVTKLRTLVSKQKRDLEQLKSCRAPRRFDPSKAFQHAHKENQQPLTPLR